MKQQKQPDLQAERVLSPSEDTNTFMELPTIPEDALKFLSEVEAIARAASGGTALPGKTSNGTTPKKRTGERDAMACAAVLQCAENSIRRHMAGNSRLRFGEGRAKAENKA